MNSYFDKFGYLTTKEQDGGDALHRESFARLVNYMMGEDLFGLKRTDDEFISDMRVSPGMWRRHPDQDKWYSNEWTTTRDQCVPLICWLRLSHRTELLDEIHRMLRSRMWFFPNNVNGWNDGPKKWWQPCDTMTPDLYAILMGENNWLAGKAMILNSRIKCGQLPSFELGKGIKWGDNTNCDDTSHIATILTARVGLGSWPAQDAISLYATKALRPPGDVISGSSLIMDRLKYWFRDEWGGNPGFADAMRPFIEKYFS